MTYKLALCSEVFRTPIEETLGAVARAGYEGIEIAPFNVAESVDEVSAERRAEIRARARDLGVDIIGLHWLLVSPKGLHLTTSDAATRSRTSEYLRSLARFSADLGATFLVLGSPQQRNIAKGDDPAAAFQRAVEVLNAAAETCGDSGIQLLVEPLHPRETNFLQTVEEAQKLIEAIGHPNVGYHLDCKAMSGMPLGVIDTIRRHGKSAGHFHANGPEGHAPGMDATEYEPILAALRASGYEGWVSVEPFDYAPDPETVAETAVRTLREAQRQFSQDG